MIRDGFNECPNIAGRPKLINLGSRNVFGVRVLTEKDLLLVRNGRRRILPQSFVGLEDEASCRVPAFYFQKMMVIVTFFFFSSGGKFISIGDKIRLPDDVTMVLHFD